MTSHHFTLCETQPFCLTCPHFILLPFSIFYLFFQNSNIITLLYIETTLRGRRGGDEQERIPKTESAIVLYGKNLRVGFAALQSQPVTFLAVRTFPRQVAKIAPPNFM